MCGNKNLRQKVHYKLHLKIMYQHQYHLEQIFLTIYKKAL